MVLILVVVLAIILPACLLPSSAAYGREQVPGQYAQSDPSLTPEQQRERGAWFSRQKMPDHPQSSCCGEGDAYYADSVFVDAGGTVFAVVTDERPDAPLGRQHIKPGTRIVIPEHKNKDTRSDPNMTGHTIIFVRWYTEGDDYGNFGVLCYIPAGEI